MAFRKTLRETMLENHKALNHQLRMRGLPERELSPLCPPEPKRRGPAAPRTSESIPLEKEVQAAIIAFLLVHPKVALVTRHNSGAMEQRDSNGKAYPIFFHKVYKRGLRIVDLDVTLKTGRRMVIECKRPGWHLKPHDLKEQEQRAYIEFHKSLGNLGGFATSIDDVIQLLGESA